MPVVPPLSPPAPDAAHARLASAWRLVVVAVLGFASGLPLALTGQAMQTWLSVQGIDLATIGFLSLVGLPYTFKFLWAPLMDRFELPWLGVGAAGWCCRSSCWRWACLAQPAHAQLRVSPPVSGIKLHPRLFCGDLGSHRGSPVCVCGLFQHGRNRNLSGKPGEGRKRGNTVKP